MVHVLGLFLLLAGSAVASTKNISVTSLVIQPDQKIMLIGNTVSCGSDDQRNGTFMNATLARLTADGKIDPTFASKGYASLPTLQMLSPAFLPRAQGGFWMATSDPLLKEASVARVDADGKIEDPATQHLLYTSEPGPNNYAQITKFLPVAAGKTLALIITEQRGVLVKFDADGTLDASFGDAGTLNLGESFKHQEVFDVGAVVLATGKILTQVSSSDEQPGDGKHFTTLLARYDEAGHLDLSFGEGGSLSLRDQVLSFLTALPGDKVLTSGYDAANRSRAVEVIGADGQFDLTFGRGGKVSLPTPNPTTYPVDAAAAAVQKDGKIVLWSYAYNRSLEDPKTVAYLTRLLPNGGFDRSFAHVGYVARNMLPDKAELPVTMVLDAEGRIVTAAGLMGVTCSTEHPFLVTRTLPDGSLDPSFGVK